jgi:hypothetical protein
MSFVIRSVVLFPQAARLTLSGQLRASSLSQRKVRNPAADAKARRRRPDQAL